MEIPHDIEDIIYLDNAATVFPKPPEIMSSMLDLYESYGVNPGRSGYDLCLVGGELVQTTRKLMTRFFGGTSILITVGVLLDTMRQMESHLLMRHYDGFLKKGRLRGRF